MILFIRREISFWSKYLLRGLSRLLKIIRNWYKNGWRSRNLKLKLIINSSVGILIFNSLITNPLLILSLSGIQIHLLMIPMKRSYRETLTKYMTWMKFPECWSVVLPLLMAFKMLIAFDICCKRTTMKSLLKIVWVCQ